MVGQPRKLRSDYRQRPGSQLVCCSPRCSSCRDRPLAGRHPTHVQQKTGLGTCCTNASCSPYLTRPRSARGYNHHWHPDHVPHRSNTCPYRAQRRTCPDTCCTIANNAGRDHPVCFVSPNNSHFPIYRVRRQQGICRRLMFPHRTSPRISYTDATHLGGLLVPVVVVACRSTRILPSGNPTRYVAQRGSTQAKLSVRLGRRRVAMTRHNQYLYSSPRLAGGGKSDCA